jgi:hypothetical protein
MFIYLESYCGTCLCNVHIFHLQEIPELPSLVVTCLYLRLYNLAISRYMWWKIPEKAFFLLGRLVLRVWSTFSVKARICLSFSELQTSLYK